MSTAHVETTPGGGGTAGASMRRITGLTRANWRLMLRNRLTLTYGLLLPLLPLALLFTSDRGNEDLGITAATTVVFLLMVFPLFYNLLSIVVSRRDELVLKRLRTGEARDSELIASMALPGTLISVAITVVTVALAVALGQPFPVNPLLLMGGVLLASGVFVALALWTAAWTRTAEAAQMTSMPVILLAMIGQVSMVFPESWQRYLELTPGAAVEELVRVGWFGRDGERSLDFLATWGASIEPLLVLVAWIAIGWALARKNMHWEPRH